MEDGWIVGYLMMKYELQWLLSVKLQGLINAWPWHLKEPSWHLHQESEENNEILPDSITEKIPISPPPHHYQVKWPQPCLHATEEHVTTVSAVMSCSNRRTAGSNIFCWVHAETTSGELKNKPISEPVTIWSRVPWDSELRITVLVRASSNIAVSQSV
jgi:hypothetical protein